MVTLWVFLYTNVLRQKVMFTHFFNCTVKIGKDFIEFESSVCRNIITGKSHRKICIGEETHRK